MQRNHSQQSTSDPSDEEVGDLACDLSSPYFRFTYNYEHSERNKVVLRNWLEKVLPVASQRTRFRNQEIIIHNGATIEEVIDGILVSHVCVTRMRTIVGPGDAYVVTLVSNLHDSGRGVGDTLSRKVIAEVRKDLCIMRGTHTDIELIIEAYGEVDALVINVGRAGNMLHCNHVNKLHDIVRDVTGHSACCVVGKLCRRNMFGKGPDMSYLPRYMATLRQMQRLDIFPTFLGEVHYTDSAMKGMFHCALQMDGSDFQSEYVLGVEIKVDKRTNDLSEVHLLAYNCTLEEMLRISRKDDLDKEQRAAVLQTALTKAQRARADIQCLIDLVMDPPQSVEHLQEHADRFRDRSHEYWKDALGSFSYRPFEADDHFRYMILRLVKRYSVIPTFRDDLNANRSYYEEQIEMIQQDLKKFGNIDVDRAPLTTKAILANRVTFVLCESGEEISVEKFVSGRKVDEIEWHIPIQAFMGAVTAHARTGACTTLHRQAIDNVFDNMAYIPNVPSEIGPLQIGQEMIIPELFGKFARQRFPGHTERTAGEELQREFERNHGVIDVNEIELKYLTDNALSTISGEDTLGTIGVSRGRVARKRRSNSARGRSRKRSRR